MFNKLLQFFSIFLLLNVMQTKRKVTLIITNHNNNKRFFINITNFIVINLIQPNGLKKAITQ